MRILLVDDEPDILDLMAIFLEKHGDIVVKSTSAGTAIALLAGEFFDLVITDMVMPVMSGMELIRHVQAKSHGTKIIAISGGGKVLLDDYLDEAASAGACAILRKPFSMTDFLERVRYVMDA